MLTAYDSDSTWHSAVNDEEFHIGKPHVSEKFHVAVEGEFMLESDTNGFTGLYKKFTGLFGSVDICGNNDFSALFAYSQHFGDSLLRFIKEMDDITCDYFVKALVTAVYCRHIGFSENSIPVAHAFFLSLSHHF